MNSLKKELHVAIHAQTARFRVVKYIIFALIFGAVYWLWGGRATLWMLGALILLALIVHFFYRWKTKGWEESWGGYTSLFKGD